MTIDRGVGLFMGVPMRTICSKRLVVLNVYTSRAPRPVCTDQLAQTKSPIVSHSTFTFGLGRERKRKRTQSPLVFRQTPATEGDDCLATTINLSSRLFRDYKFYFERATRTAIVRLSRLLAWLFVEKCSSVIYLCNATVARVARAKFVSILPS